jgi:hypothetical protein
MYMMMMATVHGRSLFVAVVVVIVDDDEAGRGRNNRRACFKMRLFRRAIMILYAI